nr:glycoside hydrolase family 97 catalytic domain-containing protein [Fulvivirga sp. M361]
MKWTNSYGKPTGTRRTYPNMMSREGARGMEWNGWSDGNPPEHHTILPFTRILAGPLDYTPGVFDLLYKNAGKRVKWNDLDKGTSRINTTLAKQLALFVVFYSPLQMASDLVENYENQPAFQFIRDVPVNWEETKVLQASIGEYVTIARKDWDSDDWYLGAITNEESRTLSLQLDFLEKGKVYIAEIYKDAEDSDWKTNPYPHELSKLECTSGDSLVLKLAPGGGQAIRFKAR